MPLTVVVPFHSGSNLLRLCLESLLQTTGPEVEVIVVMNNTDVNQTVKLDLPRVKLVTIESDLGFAAAANVGAARATGDFLIFSDHDLVFTQGWLEAVQAVHFRSPRIGATGTQIVSPHSFRILDFGIGFTRMNCPHPHLDQPLSYPPVQKARRVQSMCCGGLFIERQLFERLGGFDSELSNFYADIDLCLRLKDMGRECWVSADAVVYHFGGDLSRIERPYKASHLKSDVKALFRAKNQGRMTVDMHSYYQQSLDQLVHTGHSLAPEYVACCMMNVADPNWYVDVLRSYVRVVDTAILPTGNRDSSIEIMYEHLGYDLLKLRAPLVYLVDRFVSLIENRLWWQQRASKQDIVMDRNGNLISVADLS